mgnify:CR=1 FL=1
MDSIRVRLKNGYLVANESSDPMYPGIDVEFIKDNEEKDALSRPRVLIEQPPEGKLRVLLWNDKDNEDYTDDIEMEEGQE